MHTEQETQHANGRLNGVLDEPQETQGAFPPRVENSILQTYFGGNMDLFQIANDHNIDIDQLLDWLESEQTRTKIDRLKNAAEKRAGDIFTFALPTAATRLKQVASMPYVDLSLNEIEPKETRLFLDCARKAAALIHRVNQPAEAPPTKQPKDRSTASQSVRDPQSHGPGVSPVPQSPETPPESCTRSTRSSPFSNREDHPNQPAHTSRHITGRPRENASPDQQTQPLACRRDAG